MAGTSRSTADLIVECLENEDVTHVPGIPGASFMAGTCGRLAGRAGVCPARLSPGTASLLPGTADAADRLRAAGTVLTGVGESGRRRAGRWPS